MMTKRVLCMCVLMGVICGVSVAGSKIDGWMVDDFESYETTADMKATSLTTGGPWGILKEFQYSLGMIEWPAVAPLDINLMTGDPNGFTAVNEDDPNNQSMEVHYNLTDAASSCDVIIMAHNLGVPFAMMTVGPPLGDVPVADLTTIDKRSMKVEKRPGNTTVMDLFSLGLVGPDMALIGHFPITTTSLVSPDSVWESVEFEINGPMDTSESSSAFDRSAVSAIIIGTYDWSSSDVRYKLDDIMLFNEGVDCHAWSPADINMDCVVDMGDLSALASGWLSL